MERLHLHEFHESVGARWTALNGREIVQDYGDWRREHAALNHSAGFLDLSFRSRVCLTGSDRVRYLHGQVTNNIKKLRLGEGCYAALVTAKGRMQSDLNVYCLSEELLLDFEPGLSGSVRERLESYIVADDVQVIEVAAEYGLLSAQGPQASEVMKRLGIFGELPTEPFQFTKTVDSTLGEIYLARHARLGIDGFDVFVPTHGLGAVADKMITGCKAIGGGPCGWQAIETCRIEAGIPRFGADMDETNLPQECGIEARAVSYDKGCYIGQEVLNRVHTMGHVNRALRGLVLDDNQPELPGKGDKIFHQGKEVGFVTSAVRSPRWNKNLALGYVRKEAYQDGTVLVCKSQAGESAAIVTDLPFRFES